ncbi:MAG TPA: ParB/RepB/Spo0J family partition protein [Planctomycetota bacterium]|nr:ParB/RepB/Spo0J family partition protein [Planctomycetota bacterium]
MTARRSALGRGLDALIPSAPVRSPDAAPAQPVAPPAAAREALAAPAEIPIDRIVANPSQPRRTFDPGELERLAASIRRHGLLQPVVVRELPGSDPSRYELVVGERRWRAARLAGLASVPATVKDVASRQLLEVALVENVQRQDLNPIELALAFQVLAEGGATQEEIGRRVGLDRSSVANHLRLLELPRELQADVESGALGLGHAKAILQLGNPERRRHLRDRIVSEGLSVRAAEALARSLGSPVARPSPPARSQADPDLAHLVDALRDQLKTRVRITGNASRGKIEIEYYGAEELHRISREILEGPGGA